MYDTIGLWLRAIDYPKVNFPNDIIKHFEDAGVYKPTKNSKSKYYLINLDGLKISVSENGLRIKEGSLCRWFKGNNIETLNRIETKRAIEKLSDILHVPMEKAFVTGLDVAKTFSVKYPVSVYLNHLGELEGFKRMPVVNEKILEGLNYFQDKRKQGIMLIFYDKNAERGEKGCPIHIHYQNKYLFRFELRFKKGFSKIFGERIQANKLYNEEFYADIVLWYVGTYNAIQKVNDISLDFTKLHGKQDLYAMGVLALAEREGGQLALLAQVEEAQKTGQINKNQAWSIRGKINEICTDTGFTAINDYILELDRKMEKIEKRYNEKLSK